MQVEDVPKAISRAFCDSSEIVMLINSESCEFLFLNAAALRFLRVDEPPNDLECLLGDAKSDRFAALFPKLRERQTRYAFRNLELHGGKNERFDVSITFLESNLNLALIIVRESADQMNRQEKLAERRLSVAIEALSDGFVYYDADDRMVICNERYQKIYPRSAQAMQVGATFEEILRFGLDNGQYVDGIGREDEWLDERMEAHRAANSSIEQELSDGRWLRIDERKTPEGGHVGLRVDITALKKQQEELWKAARTDELTGLLNRRGLFERMDFLVSDLKKGQRLSILHLDLDRFKAINDVQGQEAGDFVLRYVAKILADASAVAGCVARVGGDEFIVVNVVSAESENHRSLAETLVTKISRPVLFRGQNCAIGASVGLTAIDNKSEDPKVALADANIALDRAKQRGFGSIADFEPKMRAKALHKNEMIQQIQVGIKNDEFLPYFQPQIDTANGKVVGLESLIRWMHPLKGLVPAYEFLDLAQGGGLSAAIDHIVLNQSCAAVRHLLDQGICNAKISVNLSKYQISDPSIVAILKNQLRQHRISVSNISIELLESTLLDDNAGQIITNVHALIAEGFSVELDDFGTGHAAIATLRKFDVSRIKVDRSLVKNIDTDAELQIITSTVVDLAHRLGIKALAEGVETIFEQEKLQELGCNCMQGYLHAQPMPIEEIVPWMNNRGLNFAH